MGDIGRRQVRFEVLPLTDDTSGPSDVAADHPAAGSAAPAAPAAPSETVPLDAERAQAGPARR